MSNPRSPLLAALVRANQLTAAERAQLAELIQPCPIRQFTEAVEACGFTGAGYQELNPVLARPGGGSAAAMFHFLTVGHRHLWSAPGGELLQGLRELMQCPVENREYLSQVRGALFVAQMYSPPAQEKLFHSADGAMLDAIREQGGRPFFVVGDSNSRMYVRTEASADGSWPAPLHILCLGGSAMGLANETSTSQYRHRVLQWAERGAGRLVRRGIPVFIKFGGADAAFVWTRRRVKAREIKYSRASYEKFARESVTAYCQFLRVLSTCIDPGQIRLCSLSPPCLADNVWAEVYADVHTRTSGGDYATVVRAFRELEIPDLATRTTLYAIYNEFLQEGCRALGLTYVDDFSAFIDARGVADVKFYPHHQGADLHLEIEPTRELFVDSIHRHFGAAA